MTALLSVRDLEVRFGGVRALDRISIEVEEGASCGIIGPNGSGKTTMLGAITNLTPHSGGQLFFAGTEYTNVPAATCARLGIARTFQTVRLLANMNVTKNVMVGAAVKASVRHPLLNLLNVPRALRDNAEARAAAELMLERIGIREYGSAYPTDLPYGLQRRVEIARALATDPRLLLLDEPMAGMSQSERADLATILVDLQKDGLTQILVEHDLGMIHRVCDSAYALDFGRVIAAGSPREVAEQPIVREAYLGHEAVAR